MSGIDISNWVEPLNPRELEVVELISEGMSNREIAKNLYLSIDTVKWYNKQIFSKLGVKNRTQAANKAERLGLRKPESDVKEPSRSQWVSNLPAQLTSYVGRENEISEIKDLLRHNRLVTLTGSGGSGKTRLALKVANDLLEYYRDRVRFVELAVETDPERIPNVISGVLKISGGTEGSSIDGLKRYLSRKHMMLILDNFEHLLEATPLVADLLAACPKLTILATSREKLHVYGEQEYPIHPLDLPDPSQNESAKELLKYGGIKLFVDRAKAAKPDLVFDDDQVRAVVRICELLDGLPLAIELCAPQVKFSSMEGIVDRLEASLDFLPKGPRDLPARQRTLKATLEWSYNLLNEDESVVFTRLAVFKGGGTLDGIEKVCGEGISGKVTEILFLLLDKNLITTREGRDGEIYFGLLETIRNLNTERLREWGMIQAMNRSHAEYYAKIAEQAEIEIRGKGNAYWLARLKTENDNLRSALWWSITSEVPEFALRLVGSLVYHWHYNGLSAENGWWKNQVLELVAKVDPGLRARVLHALGMLSFSLGDVQNAQNYFEVAIKLFHELGDELKEAWSSLFLASTYAGSEDKFTKAFSMGQHAVLIFRKTGDKQRLAQGLTMLGEITRVAGKYEEAKKYYEESQAIAKETGEGLRVALQYTNLGFIAYHQEKYQLSVELNKKALEIYFKLDAIHGMATHLASIAGPVGALGNHSRAARLQGAANAQLDILGTSQEHADQVETNLYLKNVRKALSEKAFNEAWEEGQRMTIQEAIAYALSDLEDE